MKTNKFNFFNVDINKIKNKNKKIKVGIFLVFIFSILSFAIPEIAIGLLFLFFVFYLKPIFYPKTEEEKEENKRTAEMLIFAAKNSPSGFLQRNLMCVLMFFIMIIYLYQKYLTNVRF
jgi:Ca2+/Na+ antiporter